LWNWALGTRQRAWQENKQNLSWIALSRLYTQHKPTKSFLKALPRTIVQETLKSLEDAYRSFFGKRARFPRFKKRGRVRSATFQLDKRRGSKIFESGKLLILPKIGKLKVRWTMPVSTFPNSATISQTIYGKWYVSLQADCIDKKEMPKTHKVVGLDFGLIDLVTTSEGKKIKAPRLHRKSFRQLKLKQRRLSKKWKGSVKRRKARISVARCHERIANQRADFLHQLSYSMIKENSTTCIEDLLVSGMIRNKKLARSIGDASWGELRRQLEYKATWYDRKVVVIDRFFPSSKLCHICGHKNDELKLSERSWTCLVCKSEHNRDINAARNVLAEGMRILSLGEREVKPVERHTHLTILGNTGDNRGRVETGKARFGMSRRIGE
jgi:putative transposase